MSGYLTTCLLVALLSIGPGGFAQTSDALPLASTRGKPAILEFKLYRGYLIITQVRIANREYLNVLIDTGADPSVVDRRIAAKLHLNLERLVGMATLNGKVTAERTVLPKLEVGPITAYAVSLLVQDLSFLEKGLGVSVDAIIGLDVLRRSSFVVDYRSKCIIFGSGDLTRPTLPFETGPPFVTIVVTLDGRPARLLVDTGASSLILFKTRWPAQLWKTKRQVLHSTNLAGRFEREEVELKAVTLGNAELGHKRAFLVEDQEDQGRKFDGLLSPAALGLEQVSFDFEHNRFGWSR